MRNCDAKLKCLKDLFPQGLGFRCGFFDIQKVALRPTPFDPSQNERSLLKMEKFYVYTFWISVLLIVLALILLLVGQGQNGTASTIVGAVSGFWLGQGSNNKKSVE